MAWWDVDFNIEKTMTAEETAVFAAEISYDERVSDLRERYTDHRARKVRFQPPHDAQGNLITEAFTRMDIYDRDEGICQLCLGAVDLMVAYPHPAALTIDHLDRHGPHTRANCRLAHNFCNNDAQWADGHDPELADARLQHKLATDEKAGPGDRFPRRSPLTGDVVNHDEWRRHASAALDRASSPASSAVRQATLWGHLTAWLRAAARWARTSSTQRRTASLGEG